ncbi:CDGSH iron-sulfur domain-containing protein [Craterilacuibacter sp. RT1T]|uniref:CDGSH iron-sulfur domain-containing protein n=1 Tax=Craterilacuibacter sp. RT1T TaxID=2942211 RepID=UPI0020C1286F|nr:CDGSH iron-sulfur domain-containing protein [Craterilacuibacter sp. RT1T]MCL6262458.1 CDGSH iron-sulfur domain-containing protein [Craterilacuibacter sp. RT1T]
MHQNSSVSPGSREAEPRYRIVILKNGPYLVYGQPPLIQQFICNNSERNSWTYAEGAAYALSEPAALCRCGASNNKPFCDGSHADIGFDGSETASRAPILEGAQRFDGPALALTDNPDYCAYARFCDGKGRVWNLVEKSEAAQAAEYVKYESQHCPAGRLLAWDKASGTPLEDVLPPSLGLIEDTPLHCSGPLWVKGGIRIESSDGSSYEIRNRVTLCRCGASQNKPFCDGSHAAKEWNGKRWQDGLPPKDTPSEQG